MTSNNPELMPGSTDRAQQGTDVCVFVSVRQKQKGSNCIIELAIYLGATEGLRRIFASQQSNLFEFN
jgi:hypothetical protein